MRGSNRLVRFKTIRDNMFVKLEERITKELEHGKIAKCPSAFQGVTKDKLTEVLRRIDRPRSDIVDAVFALLDDTSPSFFPKAASKFHFCDGATTAHIACHVGIIQRGKGKLDREGRDYWLKPLWEIGALEKVYYSAERDVFLPGHPKAKSPNSAYRVQSSFLKILKASASEWPDLLAAWSSVSEIRKRLELQAELAKSSSELVDATHADLIRDCCKFYVSHFLPGFEALFVDDSDGDRISEDERDKLAKAGVELTLDDSMPDVLLWNPAIDALWVIEAVCSDGEVDLHKVDNIQRLAERSGKKSVGFTTAYPDWKTVARRQGMMKNLAMDTYLWVREDGAKQFRVLSPDDSGK